jgi:hypothetical protein
MSITKYGMTFGPAEILRICSDPKLGVWLVVQGKREEVEIRVTKGGRLRVSKVRKAQNYTT